MNRIQVRTKIPWSEIRNIRTEIEMSGYIKSLINNKVVFHNDKYDFDFVIKEIWVHDDFIERGAEVRIIIETLTEPKWYSSNEYSREDSMTIQEVFNIPNTNLGKLLPTKRPEKFGAKE